MSGAYSLWGIALTKAHEKDPRDGAVLAKRGTAKLALGDITGAMEDYLAASQIDNKYSLGIRNIAVYYYNRGVALKNERKCAEAIVEFSSALKIDPGYVQALTDRGICLQQIGKYTEALGHFDAAIAENPSEAVPYYNRGSVLIVLGQENEARAAFSRYQSLTRRMSPTIDEIIKTVRQEATGLHGQPDRDSVAQTSRTNESRTEPAPTEVAEGRRRSKTAIMRLLLGSYCR